jgi:hypothetical protein
MLSLLMLSLPAAGGLSAEAAQSSGTQVDPDCDPTVSTCNTYEYGGEWVVDPETTMTGGGGFFALTHQGLPDTSFQYFESPWVTNQVPDNEAVMESFVLAILSQFGQVSPIPAATGTLADGTLWHLYAVPNEGTTGGMLFTVDTADPSQNNVNTILSSPANTFDQALTAVQTDIRVNGVSPLADIDAGQLMTALESGAAATPIAVTSPSPDTMPTQPPTAVAPSGQLDQSMPVGTDTIAYDSGEWQYDPANSAEQNATFRRTADPSVIFSYGQGPDVRSGGDAEVALELVDAPTAFGAQNAQQVASEVLPSGRAYALYTWEREGAAEVALIFLDVTTTPGTLRLEGLFAPPDQFLTSLTSVQQSFQINGAVPFNELDPAALATLLSGSSADTPATGPTPTVPPEGVDESLRNRMTPAASTTAADPTPTPAL